jgi:hypothetical protein
MLTGLVHTARQVLGIGLTLNDFLFFFLLLFLPIHVGFSFLKLVFEIFITVWLITGIKS